MDELSSLLENAVALAVRAHAGQVDKAGQPYILHPLRVMMRLETSEDRIVAILHDVIEDGQPEFADEARVLLPPRLLDALLAVTKQADEHGPEGYAAFIERVARDPLARRVKIADLEDNLDVRRLSSVGPKDAERLQRYLESLNKLKAMDRA